MTPEAGLFLDKARELLTQADTMLRVGLNEAAGRTAYLAGMNAAQALIFDRTGRIVKTHGGVASEFARLARSEPSLDQEQRAFLGRSYRLKEIADYLVGPGSKVHPDLARETLDMARSFVALWPPATPKNGNAPQP